MSTEIEQKLKKLLKDEFDIEDEIDDTHLEMDYRSLGINSIDFIKLLVAVEKKFKFKFNIEDLDGEKIKSLKDIILFIDNIQNENNNRI